MCKVIVIRYKCGCKAPYERFVPCKKGDCHPVRDTTYEPSCRACEREEQDVAEMMAYGKY